jgi:hypothetical protein
LSAPSAACRSTSSYGTSCGQSLHWLAATRVGPRLWGGCLTRMSQAPRGASAGTETTAVILVSLTTLTFLNLDRAAVAGWRLDAKGAAGFEAGAGDHDLLRWASGDAVGG